MTHEPTTLGPVELTRRGVEALNRRDFDAMMSLYGPDCVWDGSLWGMGIYEGRAAIRGFFEEWMRSYEELEIELEEVLDLGGGVVFAVVRQSARQVGGDCRVQLREAYVSVSVEGAFERVTVYPDIDDARAAAERAAASTR
jgi:ketosteroid isomerase-like protein